MQADLTFKTIRHANVVRNPRAFPMCKKWTAADWMLALMGEVGELANKIKKSKRDGVTDTVEEAKEAADIFGYLDLLCENRGIDLGQAIVDKFNEVSDRRGVKMKLVPVGPLYQLTGDEE